LPAKLHEFEPTTIIFETYSTMGKRSRKESENENQKSNGNGELKKSILVDDEAVDPSLALLFSLSVSAPPTYCINLLEILLIIALGGTSESATKVSI
jgi:hypothetical protein